LRGPCLLPWRLAVVIHRVAHLACRRYAAGPAADERRPNLCTVANRHCEPFPCFPSSPLRLLGRWLARPAGGRRAYSWRRQSEPYRPSESSQSLPAAAAGEGRARPACRRLHMHAWLVEHSQTTTHSDTLPRKAVLGRRRSSPRPGRATSGSVRLMWRSRPTQRLLTAAERRMLMECRVRG
jgi:hypothetical protein